jgi:hypothetical protein
MKSVYVSGPGFKRAGVSEGLLSVAQQQRTKEGNSHNVIGQHFEKAGSLSAETC